MKGICIETQHNAHAHNFACNLGAGHSEPHRDPATGLRWRHPSVPHGMRKPKGIGGSHKAGSPKHWWSAQPVVGYKGGSAA